MRIYVLEFQKGKKDEIKKFVATTGKSLNSFINEAIERENRKR